MSGIDLFRSYSDGVSPRTVRVESCFEIGPEDEGIARGVGQVLALGCSLVDIVPIERVRTMAQICIVATYTRPWVGSPMAWKSNELRNPEPTMLSERGYVAPRAEPAKAKRARLEKQVFMVEMRMDELSKQ